MKIHKCLLLAIGPTMETPPRVYFLNSVFFLVFFYILCYSTVPTNVNNSYNSFCLKRKQISSTFNFRGGILPHPTDTVRPTGLLFMFSGKLGKGTGKKIQPGNQTHSPPHNISQSGNVELFTSSQGLTHSLMGLCCIHFIIQPLTA